MKFKRQLAIILIILLILVNIFVFLMDKSIMPTLLAIADGEMRAKAAVTINNCIIKEFGDDFNYDEIIKVEKDNEGNIVMLKADTMKLNEIACDVALTAQNELKKMGQVGLDIPFSYVAKNNILSGFGPNITVKMKPIGYIETKYISTFESAGINQTRHRIFVEVKTKIRMTLPSNNNEIEITHQVPICETIIVGKIPDNAINLDMNTAGFSLPNK
ncbi:MAG: sporulation protein YunB [Clostridiales bacterium]|uniref:sporulation protein YunB n=1 Tax=Clostridium sp. N3C TaxID=1776758 RepID=UPI00092DF832|nr:sporulation protein YunB [Clostridium sp. N3C]NLZ48448.1 sporulation protein YunB [Clostridiales bacterium]SCN21477.1 Sporulation protein YunB [Clostridium sp. N3C]